MHSTKNNVSTSLINPTTPITAPVYPNDEYKYPVRTKTYEYLSFHIFPLSFISAATVYRASIRLKNTFSDVHICNYINIFCKQTLTPTTNNIELDDKAKNSTNKIYKHFNNPDAYNENGIYLIYQNSFNEIAILLQAIDVLFKLKSKTDFDNRMNPYIDDKTNPSKYFCNNNILNIIIIHLYYSLQHNNLTKNFNDIKQQIIKILLDLKKSGDWGQGIFSFRYNELVENNIIPPALSLDLKKECIFISGDRLSAARAILCENTPVLFSKDNNIYIFKNSCTSNNPVGKICGGNNNRKSRSKKIGGTITPEEINNLKDFIENTIFKFHLFKDIDYSIIKERVNRILDTQTEDNYYTYNNCIYNIKKIIIFMFVIYMLINSLFVDTTFIIKTPEKLNFINIINDYLRSYNFTTPPSSKILSIEKILEDAIKFLNQTGIYELDDAKENEYKNLFKFLDKNCKFEDIQRYEADFIIQFDKILYFFNIIYLYLCYDNTLLRYNTIIKNKQIIFLNKINDYFYNLKEINIKETDIDLFEDDFKKMNEINENIESAYIEYYSQDGDKRKRNDDERRQMSSLSKRLRIAGGKINKSKKKGGKLTLAEITSLYVDYEKEYNRLIAKILVANIIKISNLATDISLSINISDLYLSNEINNYLFKILELYPHYRTSSNINIIDLMKEIMSDIMEDYLLIIRNDYHGDIYKIQDLNRRPDKQLDKKKDLIYDLKNKCHYYRFLYYYFYDRITINQGIRIPNYDNFKEFIKNIIKDIIKKDKYKVINYNDFDRYDNEILYDISVNLQSINKDENSEIKSEYQIIQNEKENINKILILLLFIIIKNILICKVSSILFIENKFNDAQYSDIYKNIYNNIIISSNLKNYYMSLDDNDENILDNIINLLIQILSNYNIDDDTRYDGIFKFDDLFDPISFTDNDKKNKIMKELNKLDILINYDLTIIQ